MYVAVLESPNKTSIEVFGPFTDKKSAENWIIKYKTGNFVVVELQEIKDY